MKLCAVVPVLNYPWGMECLDSIAMPGSAAGFTRDELLIIDNTREGGIFDAWGETYRDPEGHNLGVARSWNVGAKRVLERGLDYLVILSASLRFGPELHTTWRRVMEEWNGAKVIECDIQSWHLIALHRSTFEKIGLFDSNFYPAYFESIDWCYRLRMVGWEQGFVRKPLNCLSTGVALHARLVSCPAPPLLAYYETKWGGPKGEEQWVQPWGSRPLDDFPERSIPELASEYGLETWW
jgi:GT2 family glycosyltransferase